MPQRDDVAGAPAPKPPVTGDELLMYLRACLEAECSGAQVPPASGEFRATGYAKLLRRVAADLIDAAAFTTVPVDGDRIVALVNLGGAIHRLEGTVQYRADKVGYTTYKRITAGLAGVKAAFLRQVALELREAGGAA
jgi:hypothetical protein